ncbi:MAG: molybdopterin-dependent oxidoreductase [Nitrospira sp.]|nr:molybdopterin-dependent oxidoreductase [Nitrospira sp.]
MGLKPGTNPDVEAATIQLNIDGKTVTAKDGISLYDVISMTGKIIPAMCYHYTFDPFGSCGMCLVMQEGKKAPVRSCTAKATAGMVIRTEGEDLFLARKKAVEKHLSVHPLDCPVCDADGHCELQDMAFEHGVTNLANAKQKFIPEDTRSPVLDFNMNRCIACAECINVCKDVLMIDALQFMKKGGFNQVVPKGDVALSCEFCGDCLAVCPVGAITNKFSKYLYKPWQMKKTTTTCNYCGDGCQMYLETKDEEVIRVPNEQGAVDMGVAPEFLPGQARFDDPVARERFAKAWGAALPVSRAGSSLVDILKGCKNGSIKALYVLGENPLETLPASMEVRAALDRLELLVVQDPFLTQTAQLAHVVFPACTYAEKDGTFTNLEGRVLRVRQAMDPIGESLPDWHIMTSLANALGCQWEYESVNDIQSEMMKLLPGYYNLGQPRKVVSAPDRYLENGYAAEVTVRYRTMPTSHDNARPFSLQMGQLLMHSGKMSTEAPGLIKIAPNTGKLRMSPADMDRLGLEDGMKVRLTSDLGSLQLGVQPDQSVATGTCFFPEHFNEPPVKDLMSVSVDAMTGVPAFKQTWVSIERA